MLKNFLLMRKENKLNAIGARFKRLPGKGKVLSSVLGTKGKKKEKKDKLNAIGWILQ